MYIIPFVIVLVTLSIIKKSSYKPYCIIIGVFSTMICSICQKTMTLHQSLNMLFNIMWLVLQENFSLFFTLILFGVLIKMITESGAMEELAEVLNCHVTSKKHFFILLLGCGLAFSVDDYLACFMLTTVLSTCYRQLDLSKKDICFFINMIVVMCCSMVPVSTWAPVITDALHNEILLDTYQYLRYCFSYFISISFIVIIIMLCIKENNNKMSTNSKKRKKQRVGGSLSLLFIGLFLYSVFMLVHKCPIAIFNENALLISCLSTLVLSQIIFAKKGKIPKNNALSIIYIEGAKDMWGIVKFLYVLWVYTECLEKMLHINETILSQITKINIPANILTFTIFIMSGIISFCTGSVFATIRLLVPMSLSISYGLGLDSIALWLAASAAINGSLLASVSPLSDTLAICCDKLNQDTKEIFITYLPYYFIIFIGTAFSYLVVGYMLEINLCLAIIGPMVLVFPMILIAIIDIPYYRLMMKAKSRQIYYLSCLYNSSVKKTVNQRNVKQHCICNKPRNEKYKSSMPIRRCPVYRLKLC